MQPSVYVYKKLHPAQKEIWFYALLNKMQSWKDLSLNFWKKQLDIIRSSD